MVQHKQAFTLIELLVVVLIIGILAAVALSQYQVAVMKSRFMELMSVGDSIRQAEEVYFLANGHYTDEFSTLDVEIPSTLSLDLYNPKNGTPALSIYSNELDNIYYVIYLDHINGTLNKRVSVGCRECRTNGTENVNLERKVCKALT